MSLASVGCSEDPRGCMLDYRIIELAYWPGRGLTAGHMEIHSGHILPLGQCLGTSALENKTKNKKIKLKISVATSGIQHVGTISCDVAKKFFQTPLEIKVFNFCLLHKKITTLSIQFDKSVFGYGGHLRKRKSLQLCLDNRGFVGWDQGNHSVAKIFLFLQTIGDV